MAVRDGRGRGRGDGIRLVSPVRLVLGLALALGLALGPALAPAAVAATGQLLERADATYTVDPAAGAVHVAIDVALTNDKPDQGQTYFYWRDVSWAIPLEASRIGVRDSAGALALTTTSTDNYIELEFRLRRDLLYRKTAKFTIAFDLVSGAPRSDSPVRVGLAFATFDVWAWGQPGRSSVTVDLPQGFEARTFGSELDEASTIDGPRLSATAIADPPAFWTAVAATRERSLARDELTLPGDVELLVLGWPEDTVWRTRVVTTLRLGLPKLQARIGLPWPVDKRLEISEVYAPLLEGYAGLYYTDEDRIDISEQLDDLTIVHEASHAWFNDGLFVDRWIGEGLADTVAAHVLVDIGKASQGPDRPSDADPGRVDLEAWAFPGRVDDETEARELYGYNASWFVVNTLYEEIGAEGFRRVFAAAAASTIAYAGAGPAELVAPSDTWRRFLDLLEEVGGSTRADDLFREYVVTQASDRELDARAAARARYDALVEDGDGWLPPFFVRDAMGSWAFTRATDRMADAEAILALRDRVAAAAAPLGLEPDDDLETAYEAATDGFDEARSIGQEELDVLTSLAGASAAATAPRDLVATIGLIGSTPAATYDEAASAFEAGDLDASAAAVAATLAVLDGAGQAGRQRLLIAGGAIAGVVFLVALAVVIRRRRRRDGMPGGAPAAPVEGAGAAAVGAGAGAGAGLKGGSGATEGGGPYGTLAADPPALPSNAEAAADPDGGPVAGEGSSSAP